MMAMHLGDNLDPQSARVHIGMPRATDAVGGALRGAYARDRSLPGDMRRLLEQLDAKTSERR
ncbi:hypothetical protein [Sphingomonas baiyangensis]|uniref:Anti-sigma factor NepR domain-containing protein n=1 Tax=Sphingomonas baiyangensis TaxID=2572576 RepID=A0A4U1L396_9SPHN|nr:hypothetical protein [Sphingomonas baiyangensis]TKD51371.1 hypothetical protein FBR43_11870 [Sphingomonas baiyangensis]